MTMNTKRIKEIQERCRAATPGPCYAPKPGQKSPKNCGMHSDCPVWSPQHDAAWEVWAECLETEEWPAVACQVLYKENAEFIAHAYTDIPDLLAEVIRLQEIVRDINRGPR
jgi:hypothetical protein